MTQVYWGDGIAEECESCRENTREADKAFHPVMQFNATTNAKLHRQACVEGVSHQFTDPAFLSLILIFK